MKDEPEDRTKATLLSRHTFVHAAAASGAGALSADLVATGAYGAGHIRFRCREFMMFT
jgi:hypothetical protein